MGEKKMQPADEARTQVIWDGIEMLLAGYQARGAKGPEIRAAMCCALPTDFAGADDPDLMLTFFADILKQARELHKLGAKLNVNPRAAVPSA